MTSPGPGPGQGKALSLTQKMSPSPYSNANHSSDKEHRGREGPRREVGKARGKPTACDILFPGLLKCNQQIKIVHT